jgi:hypothetical protein
MATILASFPALCLSFSLFDSLLILYIATSIFLERILNFTHQFCIIVLTIQQPIVSRLSYYHRCLPTTQWTHLILSNLAHSSKTHPSVLQAQACSARLTLCFSNSRTEGTALNSLSGRRSAEGAGVSREISPQRQPTHSAFACHASVWNKNWWLMTWSRYRGGRYERGLISLGLSSHVSQ